MTCQICLKPLSPKVVLPEEDRLLPNGDPSPKENCYCSNCGTQVPVAQARTALLGAAHG